MVAKHMIIAAIMFSVLGAYLHWPMMVVKTPSDIKNFPQAVGSWQGSPELAGIEELDELGAEGLVSMEYRLGEGTPIDFRLAYFEYQTQAKELAGDRVELFLLGDNPVEQGHVSVGGLHVRRIIQQRTNGYRVILSWYEVDGHSVGKFWKVVLQSMYGSLVHRQNNGAVVVIAMDYSEPMELPRAMEQLDDFMRAVVPSVKTVLPPTAKGWQW
ncbi:MAG: EpsI family protein [Nitrospira sp.]|nr:EpsI family protein [Nitrospira sp.]